MPQDMFIEADGSITRTPVVPNNSIPTFTPPTARATNAILLTDVRLFESAKNKPLALNDRIYESRFSGASTRSIYFELKFQQSIPSNFNTSIKYALYDSANKLIHSGSTPIAIKSSYDTCWTGYGYDIPGKWAIGKYRLVINIGNSNSKEIYFEIFNDFTKKDSSTALWVWSILLIWSFTSWIALWPIICMNRASKAYDYQEKQRLRRKALTGCIVLTIINILALIAIIFIHLHPNLPSLMFN